VISEILKVIGIHQLESCILGLQSFQMEFVIHHELENFDYLIGLVF